MELSAIISVTLILFSVIDIPGSLPILIDMKRQGVQLPPAQITLVSGGLMLVFLFFGLSVLQLFGLEVESFALAGSLIIFFIGLEMVLGIRLFREDHQEGAGAIVPVAFPLVAGAGTLTTIISLKAEFDNLNILIGILFNLVIVYLVLRSTDWLSRKMTPQTANTLRKVFGILLIAIAFQMFRTHM